MKKILALLDSEPIITRIGPLLGLIVVYLFARGAMDRDTYDLLSGIATLLLGSGGILGARAKVWATVNLPKQPQQPGDAAS